MNAVFTDSHAHLELVSRRLGKEALEKVLEVYGRTFEAGAHNDEESAIVLDVGIEPGDLEIRRTLVHQCVPHHGVQFVKFTAGIWPGPEALADPDCAVNKLERDIEQGVDAVGECGLDYYHMAAGPEAQKALFNSQIELALRHGLPLIVHSREAFEDTHILVAAAASRIPVIIHCFGYGPEEAHAFLESGCFISFAGNITYPKANRLREALALVPAERLLLETDSPYMNPMPLRGKASTPLDIERTYVVASEILHIDIDTLRRTITINLKRILGSSQFAR
jgi:TatD DNase family protein